MRPVCAQVQSDATHDPGTGGDTQSRLPSSRLPDVEIEPGSRVMMCHEGQPRIFYVVRTFYFACKFCSYKYSRSASDSISCDGLGRECVPACKPMETMVCSFSVRVEVATLL
eukprot:6205284-Pleurochrysis_carterae.AAC.2